MYFHILCDTSHPQLLEKRGDISGKAGRYHITSSQNEAPTNCHLCCSERNRHQLRHTCHLLPLNLEHEWRDLKPVDLLVMRALEGIRLPLAVEISSLSPSRHTPNHMTGKDASQYRQVILH